MSPAHSYYNPTTSPVTSDVPDASEYLSPESPAAMDRYLAEDGDLLLGDSSGLPLLPLPLLLIPADDVPSPESAVTRSMGGQFPASMSVSPDMSREGPFDAPHLLDNLLGCQYRMTSYDNTDMTEVDPAYGLQLHHPRFLEYVGAPESTRLLSRPPGYWLHHMDWEQAVSAALRLQPDAGLMMSNLQVFVTTLNRMSSEVMRLAFGQEQYPSEAVQSVAPYPRARRAAHYMVAMGLWHLLVPRVLPGLCRPHHATTACYVITAFRT